jgi:hypothetical protein
MLLFTKTYTDERYFDSEIEVFIHDNREVVTTPNHSRVYFALRLPDDTLEGIAERAYFRFRRESGVTVYTE